MSGVSTISRWIHLPTALGSDDRFRADEPLGAGTMQILGSNGELAARENECRTIWEHIGSADCWDGPAYNGDPIIAFDWATDGAGTFHQFCGVYRLLRYGSSGQWPRLQARCRLLVVGGNTAGILLMAFPAPQQPASTSAASYATTTSSTFVDVTTTVTLSDTDVGAFSVTPTPSTTSPIVAPAETGSVGVVAIYVGIYNTSGSSGAKATVSGITVSVVPPA